jgi:hypothetical protein
MDALQVRWVGRKAPPEAACSKHPMRFKPMAGIRIRALSGYPLQEITEGDWAGPAVGTRRYRQHNVLGLVPLAILDAQQQLVFLQPELRLLPTGKRATTRDVSGDAGGYDK